MTKLEKYDNRGSSKSDNRMAPDGGYGWFIVTAYGTANVS